MAEYHKPYVANWIERADQGVAANLALLYDVKKKDNGGAKWVKDLRQWWRKAGRDLARRARVRILLDPEHGARRRLPRHAARTRSHHHPTARALAIAMKPSA